MLSGPSIRVKTLILIISLNKVKGQMPHLLINMCIGIKITCDNQGVRVILLNATFNKISVISWGKPEYLEKTSNLLQVTDKLYHIMLYRVLRFHSDTGKYRSVLNIITSITAHHIILTAIVSVTTFIAAVILSG
jgi:hypothetical protein